VTVDDASDGCPGINRAAVDRFSRRYFESIGAQSPASPLDACSFGDSAEMADHLLALILSGTKRATAGAVADYEAEGSPIPKIGDLWLACDGEGEPRALLSTTEVRVGALDSVDAEFAWDEGEGDRSVEFWLRVHQEFFERRLRASGLAFASRMPVVFERFEIVFTEDNGHVAH
jgi:uncharacterized protein YhfF